MTITERALIIGILFFMALQLVTIAQYLSEIKTELHLIQVYGVKK